MTIKNINIGAAPDDGTGDPLRTAFEKINENFQEVKTAPGTPGPAGPAGATGPTGPAGTTGAAGAKGAKGDKGDKGDDGKDGTGVTIKGQKPTSVEIKAITGSTAGDMWIAGDTGHGWVSDGAVPTVWTDAGAIKGPKGDKGDKGDTGADSTVAGPAGPNGPAGPTGPTGPAGTMDPADKAKLDFIHITKAFDADTTQDNLTALDHRVEGISFTPAAPADPDPDKKKDHIAVSAPIVMEGTQVLDQATAAASKELITVGNAIGSLLQYETHAEDIFVHRDGSKDMEAGYTPTKLLDVATKKYVDDNSGSAAAGLFQYDYKIKTDAADPTPPVKYISFDNVTFASTTKVYINKKDRTGTDMSLFLKSITTGDWFNIHDNGDINDFVAFDVTGPAVQNGDIFEIPVSHYDDNGAFTNNERVYIHWQKDEEVIKTITDIANITKAGVYDGHNVANAPIQGDIVVVATLDSKGNIGLTLKDSTLRVYQGGIPHGGAPHFINVAADHLFGTADPVNTLGHDGDLYFEYA